MASCLLCSNRTESLTTSQDGKLYHRCPDCGYVYLDPSLRPSESEERARYELHQNSLDDPGYRRWLEDFADFALNSVSSKVSRILDFGSGPEPALAKTLSLRGYEVQIEDPYYAPGRRRGPFDLIVSLEVFEHLYDPALVLDDLVERTADGGSIAISTEFLSTDMATFDSWHYRSDPTHVGFFTTESLERTMNPRGFQLVSTDGKRYATFVRLAHPVSSC